MAGDCHHNNRTNDKLKIFNVSNSYIIGWYLKLFLLTRPQLCKTILDRERYKMKHFKMNGNL